MEKQNIQSNSRPITTESATVTLFLHLPIPIARQLLDRVDRGAVASPSSALLDALYAGEFVGSGPQPEAEIQACISAIEQRVGAADRLDVLRSRMKESNRNKHATLEMTEAAIRRQPRGGIQRRTSSTKDK